MTYAFIYALLLLVALLVFNVCQLRQQVVNLTVELFCVNQRAQPPPRGNEFNPIDVYGPFLAHPNVDAEIFDINDETVGHGTTELEVKIHAKGIVLHGVVDCVIPVTTTVAGFCLWVGDHRHKVFVPLRPCEAGDIVSLTFSLPIAMQDEIVVPVSD